MNYNFLLIYFILYLTTSISLILSQCPVSTGPLTISASVTELTSGSYSDCGTITSLTLPSTITIIAEGYFQRTTSLSEIYFTPGLIVLGRFMFSMDASPTALTSVTIPSTITTAGDLTFYQCSSLTKVLLIDGLTVISGGMFNGASSLVSLSFPSTVTSIGEVSFVLCSSLSMVILTTGLTFIGSNMFNMIGGPTALVTITIPSTLTFIDDATFAYCSSLTQILFTTGLTIIGSNMFNMNSQDSLLTTVTIPTTITFIDSDAFSANSALVCIYWVGTPMVDFNDIATGSDNANYCYFPSFAPSIIPSLKPSQPSSKPSTQPSRQPSVQPSGDPSNGPTMQPTSQPILRPTFAPSKVPSSQPSRKPTNQPTKQPYRKPSSQPTRSPTSQPSRQPSRQPSVHPSGNPSNGPTVQPTVQPTLEPTLRPTFAPSKVPSAQPTRQPYRRPSGQPSRKPSAQPTCQPAKKPSSQPTKQPSKQPSSQPAKQPSSQPSKQPQMSPSVYPSIEPSVQPVNFPTLIPSKTPSLQPSRQPLRQPSRQPSRQPTRQPYKKPSKQPSSQPSSQPTDKPFGMPSLMPSSLPTLCPVVQNPTSIPSLTPSRQPSKQPSKQPFKKPSRQPTRQPSSQPYKKPTSQPTKQPSKQPTSQPTRQPTNQPTLDPTRQPTGHPLNEPSQKPSIEPTIQPSLQPSTQPIKSPSVQPFLLPSNQPTFNPSLQPIDKPSSQPLKYPSVTPSRHPSSQPFHDPTRQPITSPSENPSSKPLLHPSNQPTCIPSRYPSSHPSKQPSTQPLFMPSSLPSSFPTINGSACPINQYYRFEINQCVRCPQFSNTTQIGSLTCKCKDGYRRTGFGLTLACHICPRGHFAINSPVNCTLCSAGTFAATNGSGNCTLTGPGQYSLEGASAPLSCDPGTYTASSSVSSCTPCAAGSFSNSIGSTSCQLCPIGFYNSNLKQVSCTPCQTGAITPAVGSLTSDQCVVLIPNFTFGTISLALVIFIFIYYIILGHFHRTSLKRKEKLVLPVAKACIAIGQKIKEKYEKNNLNKKYNKSSRMSSFTKLLIFISLSFTCCIFIVIITCSIMISKVFFNSFIIWRGLNIYIDFPPFINTIDDYLKTLSTFFKIPFPILYYLTYPLLFVYDKIGNLNLNLAAVNVTCEGSKAPLQLLVNMFILGLVIIFITADYQILWTVTYPSLNMSYLFNFRDNWRVALLNITLYVCLFMIIVNSFNPFQSFLRFLMTFVTMTAFVAQDHSTHQISQSCDNISGLKYFDSFLGYSSSAIAWLLIMPCVYTLADVLVPRKIVKVTEITKLQSNIEALMEKGQSEAKNISNWRILKAFLKYIFSSLIFLVSFDIWVTKLNELWIRSLSGIFNVNKHLVLSYPSLFKSIKSKVYSRIFDRKNDHQKLTESIQAFRDQEIKNNNKLLTENMGLDSPLRNNPRSLLNLVSSKIKRSSQKISTRVIHFDTINEKHVEVYNQIWKDSEKDNLPVYYTLCKLVQEEIYTFLIKWLRIKILCIIISYFISFVGLGHFFTRTGLKWWRFVLWKYCQFILVCFGIWTDQFAEDYRLFDNVEKMCFKDDHIALINVIRGSVGPRAILLQIFSPLTILSVAIMATCGSPLFVFGEKLNKKLPSLLMFRCYEEALEREKILFEERQRQSTDSNIKMNYWVIYLKAIVIFFTESRLISFIYSGVLFSLSVILLYSYSNANIAFIVLLLVQLFFISVNSLLLVVFIGEVLEVGDEEFIALYRCFRSNKVSIEHYEKSIKDLKSQFAEETAELRNQLQKSNEVHSEMLKKFSLLENRLKIKLEDNDVINDKSEDGSIDSSSLSESSSVDESDSSSDSSVDLDPRLYIRRGGVTIKVKKSSSSDDSYSDGDEIGSSVDPEKLMKIKVVDNDNVNNNNKEDSSNSSENSSVDESDFSPDSSVEVHPRLDIREGGVTIRVKDEISKPSDDSSNINISDDIDEVIPNRTERNRVTSSDNVEKLVDSDDESEEEALQTNITTGGKRNAVNYNLKNDTNISEDVESSSEESSEEEGDLPIRVVSINRRNAFPSTLLKSNVDSDDD